MIDNLSATILKHQQDIECWFRNKWHNYTPPFYGSVDLRNSGYKIAPVDMNLYPGGFNNINPEVIPLAIQAVNNAINRNCYQAKNILLIPENHSRNKAYLKNVYTLKFILEQSGLKVKIGSLSPEIIKKTEININDELKIDYYPIHLKNNKIIVNDTNEFVPDLIIINNDLSIGKPNILTNINQCLLPPLNAGWYMRKKSNFFQKYNEIVEEFAAILNIDSWLINPYFDNIKEINFTDTSSLEILANKVEMLLEKIKNKYSYYQITDEPYVVIKADNGTYGMGIMIVKSKDQVLNMNRKARNKMSVIKDGQQVTDLILQEGVYSYEIVDHSVAETVIYMIDDSVIGGFYRVHPDKKSDENLNSVGAKFVPLTYSHKCNATNTKYSNNKNFRQSCTSSIFYVNSVIARLSHLASSFELETFL
jgi:glutamate--cysteine ligase